MTDATPVTIVIDGRPIASSRAARLQDGVVVAPLDPFVRDIAQRIDDDASGRGFTIARGDLRIEISIGDRRAHANDGERRLPLAPFWSGSEPFVPLAVVVRALGASVAYDPATRVLAIVVVPLPLTTMTPASHSPAPGPYATFPPKETSAPVPTVTGVPRPRRTPLVVCSLPQPRNAITAMTTTRKPKTMLLGKFGRISATLFEEY